MFRNVTPEKAIEFTWLSVALMCCLPLPATATKSQILRFKILRFLGVLCACGLILPLLYAVYMKYDDPVIFTNATGLAVAVCQVPIHVYFSIIYYDRIQVNFCYNYPNRNAGILDVLQAMIEYMTNYCEKAKSSERQVLQRYVDKYSTFYGLCTVWFYVTAAVFDVGTLFVAQPFPSNAEYPFAVDYEPLKSLIFLHHVVVSFQCSAAVCMNAVAALMILFAAARFEILMLELRAVQNIESLIRCVKEYHLVRRYAQEVVSVFQHTVIYTTCMATIPLILSGLSMIGRLIEQMTDYCAKAKSYERQILQQYTNKYSMFYGLSATWFYLTAIAFIFGALFIDGAFPVDAEYPFPVNYEPMRTMIFLHQALVELETRDIFLFKQPQPLAVKVQFLFLALTALVEVFMCALPADNLMDVSANAIQSLYKSLWYEQAVEVQKIVMYSLVPQKPIVVSIACIIPIMSLNYYCSYVANAFSIFTALRIVMTDDEDVNVLRETVNTTLTAG
ncbi:uncharacterized protein LOC143342073 [Colletes latitarsis]|uniref:uncharacterized protein LOC143342073 n=1 Tax=Colletes latitarsis TaxID=2605962 RepID=UPI004035C453